MRAALLMGYGGVEQLELRDVPDPQVGPGEIRVRVAGTSINPIDWKLRSGGRRALAPLTFPTILGRDASGEVLEIGPGVSRFRIGDRVAGFVAAAYAEQVVAKQEAWVEVPQELDLVDAAALPLVALTGAQLVEEGIDARAGQKVLVTGAVGSVGRVAVFVARARGAEVWAGVRRTQKDDALKLGVRVVAIDDDVESAGLPELDAMADTVGGPTARRLLGKIRRGGFVGGVIYGEPQGAEERGLLVRAVYARSDSKRLASLVRAVADGELIIPIARRLPLSEIREAQRVAENSAGGKVVVVVG